MNQNYISDLIFDNNKKVVFRYLSKEDSINEITILLNKAYKSLADIGLKYVASYQDDDVTLLRVNNAYRCIIGLWENKIISTISIYTPKPSDNCKWYSNDFVAKIGQFAVLPELQRFGIGSRMMSLIEDEAKKMDGIKEIALDTAETAYHLIDYYKSRRYRYIETINWGVTNYNSVVLSKTL
ncbi:GNAT family N-acetyltransferase [Sporosalibacterium faouarense]|uniref:GNAT family N-acetyltransferase n=1 Tax=Sporosalibacterium faouarense TaxID=516123 RepID=UPI00141CE0FD|nr:GNAT family N-acetyltransferase [Sporosalibacterium faouarense]MTI48135.1 GNAT family N-acetyltransferase [Bacillota bacterium]